MDSFFFKEILTAVHPKLRDVTDYSKLDKPQFQLCKDIHDFVAKYLEWLSEEYMINNRQYTDKENIDYILSELDERFSTAREKLETKINNIYADPQHPLPFPKQYQAHAQLSINIMKPIPHTEQTGNDYTNRLPTVNRMNTRSNQNPYRIPKQDKVEKYENPRIKKCVSSICTYIQFEKVCIVAAAKYKLLQNNTLQHLGIVIFK